ncbi:alpha/beta fold hydrolase [Planomonospora sp. ID67723]|uniref:alpha/beta fold hydrolase n=1 Tax=Planomonospora sp. ID67723 TaxID=2738134 RepID=UPI0018C3F8D8|nr:alpha/beta fold hydrolase [Planomonospora sp. ID67723]MBG0832641.1 alpha/beta fold hydrolase [Planomonospora sp. ID67723]
MPTTAGNGIELAYEEHGDPGGPPVLLVSPAASASGLWTLHQVPALVGAGHRVITFDNRGTAPSSCPPGPYRLADLVEDTAGLIRELGCGPVAVAGASLGAMVAQELALAHPELVTGVALLGTRARADFFRAKMTAASARRVRVGDALDPEHAAVALMCQLFSPRTLADDQVAADWLDVLTAFPIRGEGAALQYEATLAGDRRDALAGVRRPALVVAFSDDLLMPAFMGRETAGVIPGATYVEIPACGHYGFLERPSVVNRVLVDFLGRL